MKKKETIKPLVEYYMKCRLPSSAGYSSGPSGDTEYETDYREAIYKNKPEGFEVAWATQRFWPMDMEGNTLVKLYLVDRNKALEDTQTRLDETLAMLSRLREAVKNLQNL